MARDYGTLNNIDVEKIDQLKADATLLFSGDVTFSNTSEDANTVDYEFEGTLSAGESILVNRLKSKYAKVRPSKHDVFENISFKIDSDTLYLKDAVGEDFAKDSPGALRIPSVNDPGIDFIANIVSAGPSLAASALTNLLWGTKVSTAWSETRLAYVWVGNKDDTQEGVKVFLSACFKTDGRKMPDNANKIGKLGSLPSEIDIDAFVCTDSGITVADYVDVPMVCIGVVKMTKSASDVWTYSALDEDTGAGKYGHNIWQVLVKGGIAGTITNSYYGSNSPSWNGSNLFVYNLRANGDVEYDHQTLGTRTNGTSSGAFSIYGYGKNEGQNKSVDYLKGSGRVDAFGAATDPNLNPVFYGASAVAYVRIYDENASYLASNDFSNAADALNLKWTAHCL
jgi:hypothetical protein